MVGEKTGVEAGGDSEAAYEALGYCERFVDSKGQLPFRADIEEELIIDP